MAMGTDQSTCIEFDEDNKPRMTGTLKNISELKSTEEQLRLFQRSIETLSDGVFITDPQFNIIKVNDAFANLAEQPSASIIGRHLLNKTFNLGFGQQLVDLRFKEKNRATLFKYGKEVFFHVLIDAITSGQGETTHYVGVLSEITQRKVAEKELRFLANHDVLTGLLQKPAFCYSQPVVEFRSPTRFTHPRHGYS